MFVTVAVLFMCQPCKSNSVTKRVPSKVLVKSSPLDTSHPPMLLMYCKPESPWNMELKSATLPVSQLSISGRPMRIGQPLKKALKFVICDTSQRFTPSTPPSLAQPSKKLASERFAVALPTSSPVPSKAVITV